MKRRSTSESASKKAKTVLDGRVICFTGAIFMPRREAENFVLSHGGRVCKTVSRQVNLVVSGGGSGSKEDKAHEKDLEIWDEDKFRQVVESLKNGGDGAAAAAQGDSSNKKKDDDADDELEACDECGVQFKEYHFGDRFDDDKKFCKNCAMVCGCDFLVQMKETKKCDKCGVPPNCEACWEDPLTLGCCCVLGLPDCQYGLACYRKNPDHFKQYVHPKTHPLAHHMFH